MFGRSLPLFKLAGFQVGVDWSWLLLAVLISWTLATGVFPSYYPDLSLGIYWSLGVIAAAGLFASIVLHELAHSLVARRYGLPIGGITLFIFGGVAQMEGEPDRPAAEFWVAIVGPITSVVVGLVCWLLAQAAAAAGAGVPVVGVLAYLASINGILALFNLVPAFPLDGGRVLRAVLWYWKGSLRWATRVASWVGGAFGIALIALGVWRVLTGDFVGGMWWFLIGLFVHAAARASYQQVLIREGLRAVPVRQLMTPNPISVPPSISLAQLIDNYVYRYRYNMFPVVEDDRLVGAARALGVDHGLVDHAALLGRDGDPWRSGCHGGAVAHEPHGEQQLPGDRRRPARRDDHPQGHAEVPVPEARPRGIRGGRSRLRRPPHAHAGRPARPPGLAGMPRVSGPHLRILPRHPFAQPAKTPKAAGLPGFRVRLVFRAGGGRGIRVKQRAGTPGAAFARPARGPS
jgi:Zn-dependent protease